jgi:hypothetical protein
MPPNTKPVICFVQDECIFKHFLFTGKAWTAPDGQKPVIPKDEGLGAMKSTFVSRKFGFGMSLSDEDLKEEKLGGSVTKCMDSTGVLTIEHRRLFGKRSREYMLAYSILDHYK